MVSGDRPGSFCRNRMRLQMSLKSWLRRSNSSTWAARCEFTTQMSELWNRKRTATAPLLPWKQRKRSLTHHFVPQTSASPTGARQLVTNEKPAFLFKKHSLTNIAHKQLPLMSLSLCISRVWDLTSREFQRDIKHSLMEKIRPICRHGYGVKSSPGFILREFPQPKIVSKLPACVIM